MGASLMKPAAGSGRSHAHEDRLLAPCSRLLRHLESKDDILLLTTSNRYSEHAWDTPKSTQLASWVADQLKQRRQRVVLMDVATLRIHTCEGNISGARGNNCGPPGARLRDGRKNPTGQHRCWASINNEDDQLYRVSRALFRSRVVIFFASARWGQTNSVYQRLLERLSWIENRVSSLGEEPIAQLEGLEAGMVLFGHNWHDAQILETQRQNFRWFGWKTPDALSFAWQFARTADVESRESYLEATGEFEAFIRIGRPASTSRR
jgi:hypothetical protein